MNQVTSNNLEKSSPNLLYICDFPPSNLRGGAILIERLLADYPRNKLVIISADHYLKDLSYQQNKWDSKTVSFPLLNPTGRWGIGRLRSIFNWLSIPILSILAFWQIRNESIEGVITIAHGYFFIAATIAAKIARIPLILIIHDDWVDDTCRNSVLVKYYAPTLFKWMVQSASHIYAISLNMQFYLKSKYKVSSELQMAAIEIPTDEKCMSQTSHHDIASSPIKIVYAGTITGFVSEGIELLVQLVNQNPTKYDLPDLELHLYTPDIPQEVKKHGGPNERIIVHDWVSQPELNQALNSAYILFLPISFQEDQKFLAKTSFPSKLANYLLARRPILILGPAYASLVQYAREYRFAEIVDESSQEKLAHAIAHIINDPFYTMNLLQQSFKVLHQNHSIVHQQTDFRKQITHLAKTYSEN